MSSRNASTKEMVSLIESAGMACKDSNPPLFEFLFGVSAALEGKFDAVALPGALALTKDQADHMTERAYIAARILGPEGLVFEPGCNSIQRDRLSRWGR